MKLSRLIEMLSADLAANGDSEHVAIGLVIGGIDGKKYRLDAVLVEDQDTSIHRDHNYANGMTCIAADYRGEHTVSAWRV